MYLFNNINNFQAHAMIFCKLQLQRHKINLFSNSHIQVNNDIFHLERKCYQCSRKEIIRLKYSGSKDEAIYVALNY